MKRILFGLMSVCMILLSCKKEHSKDTSPVQTSYKVAFNVGFSQQTANFKTAGLTTNDLSSNAVDTALSNNIDVLYYAVYDSVGNNVHIIKQLSTAAGFGSYTDNLHTGTYTVVIAGGKTGFVLGPGVDQSVSKLSADILSYGYNNDMNGVIEWNVFNQDAFYKKTTIKVVTGNTSQNISLDRIVSKLEIDIEDELPPSAKSFKTTITGMSSSFLVGSASAVDLGSAGQLRTIENNLTKADSGTTNYKISTLLLYSSPLSVDLACYSGVYNMVNPPVIAEKIIPNVTCQPNAETILTGDLFGGAGTNSTGGFKLLIDTAWSPNPIVKSFP